MFLFQNTLFVVLIDENSWETNNSICVYICPRILNLYKQIGLNYVDVNKQVHLRLFTHDPLIDILPKSLSGCSNIKVCRGKQL